MNGTESSKAVEEKSGSFVGERIEVGTELVSGNEAANSPFDLKDPLSRDPKLLPFRNRIGANAEAAREFGLGHNFENRRKGDVLHLKDYIHRRFIRVNHGLIDATQSTVDHKRMVDTPRPEHYSKFSEWLEAVRSARGMTQVAVSKVAGVTPQAVSKWIKHGGSVEPEPLRRLANWSGADYAALRLLLEEQPLQKQDAKAKNNIRQPSADAQRIARKLDLLVGDETSISAIEALVDTFLTRHAKQRKHG